MWLIYSRRRWTKATTSTWSPHHYSTSNPTCPRLLFSVFVSSVRRWGRPRNTCQWDTPSVVVVTLRTSLSLANQQIRRDASEESQPHRSTHSLSDVLDREEFSAKAHHAPFNPGRCLWFLKLIDGINKWCQTHHAARLLITSTGARSFFFLSYFLKLIMNWN